MGVVAPGEKKYPKHVPSLVHSTRTYLPMKIEQTVFRNVGI